MAMRAFGSLPSMIARLTPISELYLLGGLILPESILRPRGRTLPPSSMKPRCRCIVEAEITSYATRRKKSERSSSPSSNVSSKEFAGGIWYDEADDVVERQEALEEGSGGKGFQIDGVQGSSFRVSIRRILHGRDASADATKTTLVQ